LFLDFLRRSVPTAYNPHTSTRSALALVPGSRLGGYEILALIGQGGMGEVYRARDARLGRNVAIKVLPDGVAADPERLARFEREAQVLASLNHPNIAHIHGIEDSTGPALVMELVDGPTLADRIAKGPIPLNEVLSIAKQIADALEAAHGQGIIHRDLKPANIKVRPDGTVKVLDFGLAKLVDSDPSINRVHDLSMSPTMPQAGTMAGVILGTAAYMSPEQARGRVVDKRADIWAFGCVVFEALAGTPPFTGDTLTDIVAAVVKNEPDWKLIPASTPRPVVSALRGCLAKDPNERWHDIADVRIEMSRPVVDAIGAAAIAPTSRWRRVLAPVAGLALGVLVTAGVFAYWSRATAAAPTTRLDLDLPAGVELYTGNAPAVAITRDGRRIAFLGILGGIRRIYLRSLDRFDASPLPGTEQAQTMAFSPDGTSLAFMNADRTLKRISLSDGLVTIVAHDGGDPFSGVAWSDDGLLAYGVDGRLVEVPASGGSPELLTTLDAGKHELFHLWPSFIPNGHSLLYSAIRADGAAPTEILGLTKTGRQSLTNGLFPLYASSGHVIFCRDRDLIAAPFNPNTLQIDGTAVRVVADVGVDPSGAPLAAVSPTGALIYAPGQTGSSHVVWVSREGIEQAVTDSSTRFGSPKLAPDGKTIAMQAGGRLWLRDVARNASARLTSDFETTIGSGNSLWAHDGKHLAFRSRRGMRWLDVNGSGASRAIADSKGVGDVPTSLSPDDSTLLFSRQSPETSSDIYAVSLTDGGQPRPIVTTPAFEGGAQFSPDGRWIAYASNESGRFEIYIRAYRGPERRWPVSTTGGSFPMWRRDGKELFYRSGDKMMAISVSSAGDELTLSPPHMLFEQRYTFETSTIANYDVNLDGTRFLMVKDDFGAGRLNVILNWAEELKRLAPARH
jgi:WD40 repeat protein